MAEVETVRGPVSDGELGTTLMHEHVFIMQPEALQNYGHAFGPAYWNEQERLDDADVKDSFAYLGTGKLPPVAEIESDDADVKATAATGGKLSADLGPLNRAVLAIISGAPEL